MGKSDTISNHSHDPKTREDYLINLAINLVEERLKNGTATSQEVTHFLKLGSQESKLKNSILEEEKKLIKAKTENLQSIKKIEELYQEAMESFKRYGGNFDTPDDEYKNI